MKAPPGHDAALSLFLSAFYALIVDAHCGGRLKLFLRVARGALLTVPDGANPTKLHALIYLFALLPQSAEQA
jgi:hypothetical protein